MVLQSYLASKAFDHSPAVQQLRTGGPHTDKHAEKHVGAQEIEARDQEPDEEALAAEHPSSGSAPSRTDSTLLDEPANTKKTADSSPENDPFEVKWDADEPLNPQNWSRFEKWSLVMSVAMIGTLVGVAASIDSAGAEFAAAKFGVSEQVVELQTALFLVGFGVSAPLFGPLSEISGRVPIYVYTLGIFSLFEVGCALAPNIQTRVILRFFAGFFGSSPLSNAGGSVADIVNPRERTIFFAAFAMSGFFGPVLGPVIGGYLAMNVGQEWCDWILAIWGGALTLCLALFMKETYAPVLLGMKAKAMRKASGDDRYLTALEKERKKVPFIKHLRHALATPFLYLIYEPIVLLTTLYMSCIYIILFGDLEAFPIIFKRFSAFENNAGLVGLTFIPVAVGLAVALVPLPWIYSHWCRKAKIAADELTALKAEGKEPSSPLAGQPAPEERLIHAIYGTWLVPIALFWQGWTSILAPDGSPWPTLIAGGMFGTGILCCFISSYQYIIDVYGIGSASALASLTFVRYIISGGAVMFTPPMYKNLGTEWALTLLGCLSVLFSFVPILFYFYGAKIRSKSRYARF